MEKPITNRTTTVSPIRLMSTMKKNSASICGAIFDASGGNSAKFVIHLTRNCQSTWLMCSIPLSVHLCFCVLLFVGGVLALVVAAEHDKHESAQRKERDQASELHHSGHNQRVLVHAGIVVIAVRENVVDARADFAVRGFGEAEAQILGRIFHAHVILRQLAVWSDQLN